MELGLPFVTPSAPGLISAPAGTYVNSMMWAVLIKRFRSTSMCSIFREGFRNCERRRLHRRALPSPAPWSVLPRRKDLFPATHDADPGAHSSKAPEMFVKRTNLSQSGDRRSKTLYIFVESFVQRVYSRISSLPPTAITMMSNQRCSIPKRSSKAAYWRAAILVLRFAKSSHERACQTCHAESKSREHVTISSTDRSVYVER